MSSAPSPDRRPWFDPAASPAAKLRAVTRRSRLTWEDYYDFCWSFPRAIPLAVRRAVARRLDVMSGPYEDTLVLANDDPAGMVGMLRVLFASRTGARALWATLLATATPEGRRRLVMAEFETNEENRSYGNVWAPEVWRFLPPAYAAASVDEDMARALLEVFETGLHREDPSQAPGELWAKAVAALNIKTVSIYTERLIRNLARWFLADPSRLSAVAVGTLLASPHAPTRAWVLTDIVPRCSAAPTIDPSSARAARPRTHPLPRRPRAR